MLWRRPLYRRQQFSGSSVGEDGEIQRQEEQGSPWDGVVGMGLRGCSGKSLSLSWFPELLLPKFLLFAPVSSEEEQGPVRREMPS